MKSSLLAIAAVLMLALTIACPTGCAPQPDAATKSKVQTIANQAAVDQANAAAKDKLDQAKASAKGKLAQIHGQNSPVTHPIAAANEAVKALRPVLIVLSIIGVAGWICSFALATQLPFLASWSGVFRWVAVLSVTALFTLPFLPLGFLCLAAAVVALVIYELIKTKSIPETETVLRNDFGQVFAKPAAQVTAH